MSLDSGMAMPFLATLAAVAGALIGLALTGARGSARQVVGFSGGLLLGVAVFGLLPEVVHEIGWPGSALLFAAGYLLLMGIDRYIYPVCPACSHDHDHDACATELHGFAAPLIVATAFHAFLDGWGIATAQWAGKAGLIVALPVALALHKIPEGIALGALLRASMRSRVSAFGWCLATESMTVFGAGSGLAMAPHLGVRWLHYPLAMAGGCFFYLGFHAVHGEWRRRKRWAAFVPGITGAAGAAALMWHKL
jgi:zinc transporter ZupT